MKPLISKEETISSNYLWLWPLFCLQAGLINSGGFLACHRFVSHVTGFGTRVGMEFIQNNILLGLEMSLIPIGFILGCMIAAFYNESKNHLYHIPLALISIILVIVSILGELNLFGPFGEPLILARDFFLLFLLCLVCGLQNGLLASMTGGIIRTTHMTGIATDIGLSLVRVLRNKNRQENPWLKLRLLKFFAFSFGATAGALVFFRFEYAGFLIAAAINIILSWALKRRLLMDKSGENQSLPAQGQWPRNAF